MDDGTFTLAAGQEHPFRRRLSKSMEDTSFTLATGQGMTSGTARNGPGTVPRAPGQSTCIDGARDELHSFSEGRVTLI